MVLRDEFQVQIMFKEEEEDDDASEISRGDQGDKNNNDQQQQQQKHPQQSNIDIQQFHKPTARWINTTELHLNKLRDLFKKENVTFTVRQ